MHPYLKFRCNADISDALNVILEFPDSLQLFVLLRLNTSLVLSLSFWKKNKKIDSTHIFTNLLWTISYLFGKIILRWYVVYIWGNLIRGCRFHTRSTCFDSFVALKWYWVQRAKLSLLLGFERSIGDTLYTLIYFFGLIW